MNGKAAKRIRLAASICGRSAKALKKEYKQLPYHRRKGISSRSHSASLKDNHNG